MKGIIKKIKDIFPVTTTRAVYIDGTNKTLQEAIDNGEIGSNSVTATTSGRGYAQIKLRSARIYIEVVENSISNPTTLRYYFPTDDNDRMRRMYCWTPSGVNKSIDIPDGELALNDALVYNFDTNTLEVRNKSWGNVTVGNNEIVLLYNDLVSVSYAPCISGVLAPYIITNFQYNIPILNIEAEMVSSTGNPHSQGMFIIEDKMYLWGHSSDDLSTLTGSCSVRDLSDKSIASFSHYLGHMNAPSYSHTKDMMIVGNGSKIYDQTDLSMKGYICKNFKESISQYQNNLKYSDLNTVEIDLSQFVGEYKAQLCWGTDNGDDVYLMTCDNKIVRKLTLGKGSNNLGNGIFKEDADTDEYNGTFSIDGVWKTWNGDTVGGFKYYNGRLYTGVKGNYGVREITLCTDGIIQSRYIVINGFVGTVQAIDVLNEDMYVYTDTKGYKITKFKF